MKRLICWLFGHRAPEVQGTVDFFVDCSWVVHKCHFCKAIWQTVKPPLYQRLP